MKFKALLHQNPMGFISMLVLVIFTIISIFVNELLLTAFAVASAIVLCINIIYSLNYFRSTVKYIRNLNDFLVGKEGNGLTSFPLPAMLCDKFGNIVWYNKQFETDIIADEKVENLSADDFFDEYSFSEHCDNSIVSAEYGDRRYTAFAVKIENSKAPMLCYYLYDDTHFKAISEEFEISRPFVMLVLVDNIEQLSRQLTDSKFALVSSGIESHIEEWLKDEPVVLKRIGNGNYLVIGEKRTLETLCENKFSVLNRIRTYEYNGTPVNATLSIGVGTGDSFSECELKARKSLDMSLGRGGDQAAVFTEEGYIYFGGVSNRANDNSRVSPRQTAANLSTLMKKFKQVIVVGHKYSDYDAIGAALGVHFFAVSNGVKAYVVADLKTTLATSLINTSVNKGYDPFITPSRALDICGDDTLVVVVDTHRQQLLDCADLYDLAGETVVIDHHRLSDDYLDDAQIFYCYPSSSSSCELVTELIEYSNIQDKIPSVIATALLAGIVLDTRDYVLRTSQRTFEAAGFLRDNGADTVTVKRLFSIDAETSALKHEIISTAKIYGNFMIGMTASDSKNIRIITSVAADEMLNIDNVKASFVISKIGLNKMQISARSLGEVNVQLIMEYLDGGGHSTMAAAQVKASSLEQAKQLLLEAIDKYNLSK